jgi:hypothetical protein
MRTAASSLSASSSTRKGATSPPVSSSRQQQTTSKTGQQQQKQQKQQTQTQGEKQEGEPVNITASPLLPPNSFVEGMADAISDFDPTFGDPLGLVRSSKEFDPTFGLFRSSSSNSPGGKSKAKNSKASFVPPSAMHPPTKKGPPTSKAQKQAGKAVREAQEFLRDQKKQEAEERRKAGGLGFDFDGGSGPLSWLVSAQEARPEVPKFV